MVIVLLFIYAHFWSILAMLLQLSSKCDNRLFRVCFDSPNTPHYPFLRAFSRPIRCVSRNRNHRIPAGAWKQKPNITVFPQDGIGSTVDEEMMVPGELVGNGETVCNGIVNSSINIQGPPFLPGQPPSKRPRTTTSDKTANDGILAENSTERMGLSIYGDVGASPLSGPFHRPLPPQNSPAQRAFAWSLHLPAKLPYSRIPISMDMGFSHGVNRDDDHVVAESPYLSKLNQDNASGATDFLVYKYCLENVQCRAEFLKRLISNKSDLDLLDFARRVSDITGCRHNGYFANCILWNSINVVGLCLRCLYFTFTFLLWSHATSAQANHCLQCFGCDRLEGIDLCNFFVISLLRQVQVQTDVCNTFYVVNKAGSKF